MFGACSGKERKRELELEVSRSTGTIPAGDTGGQEANRFVAIRCNQIEPHTHTHTHVKCTSFQSSQALAEERNSKYPPAVPGVPHLRTFLSGCILRHGNGTT